MLIKFLIFKILTDILKIYIFLQGTRWVGWNKTMTADEEVEITLNFTDTRLFTHVDIHTNNMFTKDVQVRFI